MATIMTLPIEILLDIFEYLIPRYEPIIGEDATWKGTEQIRRWWNVTSSPLDSVPIEGQEVQTQGAVAIYEPWRDLISLRLTNRIFNEICIPALYHDLDLIPTTRPLVTDHPFLTKHAQHVRTIRLWIGKSQNREEHQKLSLQALEMCKGVTTLALYYEGVIGDIEDSVQVDFAKDILSHLEGGKINTIGVYDLLIHHWSHSRHIISPGLAALLEGITSSPKVASRVETLEVSIPMIPIETYDDLRSNLINLRALSLRRCIENELGRLWDVQQQSKWFTYRHLTHLQLVDCEGAYAPHIPELVRLFPALDSLLIYACGSFHDEALYDSRWEGWSLEQDALCNVRPPLKFLRIEHMLDWEILALATIPVINLIITCVIPHHVPYVFIKDPEAFPGLKLLRLDPPEPQEEQKIEPISQEPLENPLGLSSGELDPVSTSEIGLTEATIPAPDQLTEPDSQPGPTTETTLGPEPEAMAATSEASDKESNHDESAAHSTFEDICTERAIEVRRDAEMLISSVSRPRPYYFGP